jgi:hypothetical protein
MGGRRTEVDARVVRARLNPRAVTDEWPGNDRPHAQDRQPRGQGQRRRRLGAKPPQRYQETYGRLPLRGGADTRGFMAWAYRLDNEGNFRIDPAVESLPFDHVVV